MKYRRPPKEMTLHQAMKVVRTSLEVLDDMAKMVRGGVLPETRLAFKMVLRAARESAKKAPKQ